MIGWKDIKYMLLDCQNERAKLLKRIEELEKENDQLVELAAEINKTVKKEPVVRRATEEEIKKVNFALFGQWLHKQLQVDK